METKDFLCLCLGVSSSKVDDICDAFDLDINESDIQDIVSVARRLDDVGNILISRLYQQVIDTAIESYGCWIEEERFCIYTNGRDSHLMYDSEEIYSYQDIEDIVKELVDEEYIQEWWDNLDFEQLENVTGLKSYKYSSDDGYQEYIDACNDWFNMHNFTEKQEMCIYWSK